MRDIQISVNKPCFCNSGKKFKLCHGLEKNFDVLQSNKLHILLKEVYSKYLEFVRKNYDLDLLLEEFMQHNNIKEENIDNFKASFVFVDFLVFRAQIEEEHKDYLYSSVLENINLSDIELEFLTSVRKSKFSFYKVLSCDKNLGVLELENIFEKNKYKIYDKVISSNIHEGGIVYGRVINCFEGFWMLPTFHFKEKKSKLVEDLPKVIEGFEKRFENIQKEEGNEITDIVSFVDSVEYEIYGGENPYETFDMDERLKKYLDENPDKTEDDFLDLIEEEMLGLK